MKLLPIHTRDDNGRYIERRFIQLSKYVFLSWFIEGPRDIPNIFFRYADHFDFESDLNLYGIWIEPIKHLISHR